MNSFQGSTNKFMSREKNSVAGTEEETSVLNKPLHMKLNNDENKWWMW